VNWVIVGLGANISDPLEQLATAHRSLTEHADLAITATSSVYISPPLGPQDQPDFFNAVATLSTTLKPDALLELLLATEDAMGRQRTRKWGERCIDLDLLVYNDLQMDSESLVIPHPRAHQRRFVLEPLIELLGERFELPGKGALGLLRTQCADQKIRVLCEFPGC
jgi:2-amino-4-hydroxy-6-hydroxymethyldihydropteridine diphosphokinase